VHFNSHVSVLLPTVDSLCFGVTLNRLLLLQTLTILLKFGDLLAVRCYVVDAEFCENLILFGGVMKMCSGVYFFPGHSVQLLSNKYVIQNMNMGAVDLLTANTHITDRQRKTEKVTKPQSLM